MTRYQKVTSFGSVFNLEETDNSPTIKSSLKSGSNLDQIEWRVIEVPAGSSLLNAQGSGETIDLDFQREGRYKIQYKVSNALFEGQSQEAYLYASSSSKGFSNVEEEVRAGSFGDGDQTMGPLAKGDINGDGRDDLAFTVSGGGSEHFVVLFQEQSGQFGTEHRIPLGELEPYSRAYNIYPVDLDFNGRSEIIVSKSNNKLAVFEYTGKEFRQKGYIESHVPNLAPNYMPPLFVDIDSNGWKDYVRVFDEAQPEVFLNGANGFSQSVNFANFDAKPAVDHQYPYLAGAVARVNSSGQKELVLLYKISEDYASNEFGYLLESWKYDGGSGEMTLSNKHEVMFEAEYYRLDNLDGGSSVIVHNGGLEYFEVSETLALKKIVVADDDFWVNTAFEDLDGDGDLDIIETSSPWPRRAFLQSGVNVFGEAFFLNNNESGYVLTDGVMIQLGIEQTPTRINHGVLDYDTSEYVLRYSRLN